MGWTCNRQVVYENIFPNCIKLHFKTLHAGRFNREREMIVDLQVMSILGNSCPSVFKRPNLIQTKNALA